MSNQRVTDDQLLAVVEMIRRRAEAADLTGDEVTLDSLEMMALDLYEARQEIRRLEDQRDQIQESDEHSNGA